MDEPRLAKVMAEDSALKRVKDKRFADEALRWLPDVARFALSLAREEADADDLVQETYLKAYQAWDTYAAGTECRGWLFTICRHTHYRHERRESIMLQCDDPELEALAAAAVHASAETSGLGDLFTQADIGDALDRAIQSLPDQFRAVVVLVDIQDQSYAAAAGMIGVPVGTIRSRLFRGRRMLQESLLDHARDMGIKPITSPGASALGRESSDG